LNAIPVQWDAAFEGEQAVMAEFETILQHSLSEYYACAVDEVHMFVEVDTHDNTETVSLAKYIVIYEACAP
jgi:hypothetical protein